MSYDVTLIPGDGTGPVLTACARRVLDASGVAMSWDVREAGRGAFERRGDPLPSDTLDSLRSNGVALKGPLSTPAVAARVSGSALQFRELRDIQVEADGSYDAATRHADVSSLQVRGPWGGVTGNGSIALDGQSRVRATIDNLDAGTIMRALQLPNCLRRDHEQYLRRRSPSRNARRRPGP